MTNFSTFGGVVTRGETLAKLLDHIRQAQDMANVISHLHNTEDSAHDKHMARMWQIVGEQFDRMHMMTVALAANKLQ